ncbi:helix-turn-helix domain-containing protein [Bartonella rattimassiliensis]|uniref:Plasmid replication protein C N-terminal domain-containing protein n=1 Tax=Bartonella rattimassiliensis 15908 TaxID=1094556 RepID=J0Z505_9HYPH|nr:helix-turn-helix domain-containing protein [Bartonella rattimassiliensis]EJF82668.1 hypothetical protein MCY_01725 [Bartonella rattimassiliensis 15908]
MVNKVFGRKLSAHHLEFRELAENAQMGTVSRGQLFGLVKKLGQAGLIKDTEAKLLSNLLSTTSNESFEKGGVPIVFKGNRRLSYDLRRSESRVSFLLSVLYDKGLIVMRDSGNFKRYPISNKDADIVTACGIDLRILIARYDELTQIADSILEARLEAYEKKEEALKCFKGLVRQIKSSYALIEVTPLMTMVFSRVQKIIDIIGRPAKASVEKLHKAIRLFELILKRFFKHKTAKTRYKCCENKIHKEYNTSNIICNCNKKEPSNFYENNQNTETTENYAKIAYENIQKGKDEEKIPSKAYPWPQIKPEMLAKALHNTAIFADYEIQTECDLIPSMYPLSRMMKISESAVEKAKKYMGIKKNCSRYWSYL